jgi:hypothetical protein
MREAPCASKHQDKSTFFRTALDLDESVREHLLYIMRCFLLQKVVFIAELRFETTKVPVVSAKCCSLLHIALSSSQEPLQAF